MGDMNSQSYKVFVSIAGRESYAGCQQGFPKDLSFNDGSVVKWTCS